MQKPKQAKGGNVAKRLWPYWLIRVIVLAVLIRFPFDWYSAAALALLVDVIGGFVSSHIFRKAAKGQMGEGEA